MEEELEAKDEKVTFPPREAKNKSPHERKMKRIQGKFPSSIRRICKDEKAVI